MSSAEFPHEEEEGYFASVSDLMVGILFVFLLMLTVFALNFRDEQSIARKKYDDAMAELATEKQNARDAQARAEAAQEQADREKQANRNLRGLLNKAVARMKQDLADREEARRRLIARLESSLEEKGVSVIPDPEHGVLRLPESLLFEKGQSTLGAGKGEALSKLAESLSVVLPCFVSADARPDCDPSDGSTLEGVLVEGHSDRQRYTKLSDEDSRKKNDLLSVERALTVFNELRRRPDLDAIRNAGGLPLIAVSAYGDRRPVDTSSSEDAYKKNRRIDLRFLLSSRTSDELQKLIDAIKPALEETP